MGVTPGGEQGSPEGQDGDLPCEVPVGRLSGEDMSTGAMQRRAVHGWIWTAVQSGVAVPIGFAANLVLTRALGPDAFGRVALLSAAIVLGSAVAGGGVGWAALQWSVAAWSRGARDQASTILAKLTGWRLLVQVPVLVLIGVELLHSAQLWVVAAFAAITLVFGILEAATIGLTVTQRTAVGAKIAIGVSLLSQLSGVAVALTSPSANGVWLARYAAAALGPLLALLFVDRRVRHACLHPRLPRGFPSGFWSFSVRFWGSTVLGMLVFSRSEVFILEFFGKIRSVGFFALAYGLAAHLTAPVDASVTPMVAGVGGVLATAPESAGLAFLRAQRLVALGCGTLLAVVVPPLVVAVPLLYGERYREVGGLLAALAVVATLRALKHPTDVFLNARHMAGVLLTANVWSLGVDAALALGLIPAFAAWGAVVASAMGQILSLSLQVRAELRCQALGARSFLGATRSWVVGLASGAAALGTGEVIITQIGILGATGCAVAIGAVSFVLGARLAGGVLLASDRAALVSALPPRVQPAIGRVLGILITL